MKITTATRTTTKTTTTTMDVIEHGRHLRSRAAPHPGTVASSASIPFSMRLFPFASCTLQPPFRPLGVTLLAHPLLLSFFILPSLALSFSDLYLLYTPRIVLTPFAPFPMFSPSSLLSAHTALYTRSPSNFYTLSFP